MMRELTALLGRRVDLAVKPALKPLVRPGVLAEAGSFGDELKLDELAERNYKKPASENRLGNPAGVWRLSPGAEPKTRSGSACSTR